MSGELAPVLGIWKVIEKDPYGQIVDEREISNLVVNTGREMLLRTLFMVGASAGVVAMGVGASSIAASVNDITLTYELTGNGIRKTLTNTSGAALSASDIVVEVVTINSVTYNRKVVAQAVWQLSEGVNGNVFGEYGLFSTVVTPTTALGTSGVMFNHLIDPSPIPKTGANSITSQVTIRF